MRTETYLGKDNICNIYMCILIANGGVVNTQK